ncbi:hypothetical protein ACFTUC_25610 [Streptomyces sp. NPDC056944]|uniref:hypothetical protein n=1 Tax=Streptomyces sp. NPDC056944 TaxID=3345972 RepID=UPI00363CE09B
MRITTVGACRHAQYRGGVHAQASSHTTTTTERGSFALARCSCGWSGPARRSRDKARSDAADHLRTNGS